MWKLGTLTSTYHMKGTLFHVMVLKSLKSQTSGKKGDCSYWCIKPKTGTVSTIYYSVHYTSGKKSGWYHWLWSNVWVIQRKLPWSDLFFFSLKNAVVVISRFGYCSACSCPPEKSNAAQNMVRVLAGTKKRPHIISLLPYLHWFLVHFRIHFEILILKICWWTCPLPFDG